jgi:hypothetical protein
MFTLYVVVYYIKCKYLLMHGYGTYKVHVKCLVSYYLTL